MFNKQLTIVYLDSNREEIGSSVSQPENAEDFNNMLISLLTAIQSRFKLLVNKDSKDVIDWSTTKIIVSDNNNIILNFELINHNPKEYDIYKYVPEGIMSGNFKKVEE